MQKTDNKSFSQEVGVWNETLQSQMCILQDMFEYTYVSKVALNKQKHVKSLHPQILCYFWGKNMP